MVKARQQDPQRGPPTGSAESIYASIFESIRSEEISESAAAAASVSAASVASASASTTSSDSDDFTRTIQDSSPTSFLTSAVASQIVTTSIAALPTASSESYHNPSDTFLSAGYGTSSTLEGAELSTTQSPQTTTVVLGPSSGSSQTSTPASSASSVPDGNSEGQPFHDRHHVPNAAIAAAVVVPIIIILLLFAGLLLCLRRRRKQQGVAFRPVAEAKEKIFHRQSGGGSVRTTRQLTNPTFNPTYFTGLDTESVHSNGPTRVSGEDPPPPYRLNSTALPVAALSERSMSTSSTIAVPARAAIYSHSSPVPVLHVQEVGPLDFSPFNDPPGTTVAADRQFGTTNTAGGLVRPDVSRNASSRSITSTLYSSNASVYEAHPARLSVGGAAHMVATTAGMEEERSPFADPEPEEE